jgi:hypothetical protein
MKPRPAPNAHDGAVQPAAAYTAASDLAIVTCYFNPSGYTSKLENFALFRDRIVATGLHLAIVECTFGERPRELPLAWGAAHVVAPDVVWQKERLLNLAVAALPPQFTKVAWIDADVLFTDPDWARNTARALDDAVVVQLFETGVLLPRAHGVRVGGAAVVSRSARAVRSLHLGQRRSCDGACLLRRLAVGVSHPHLRSRVGVARAFSGVGGARVSGGSRKSRIRARHGHARVAR